MTGRNTTAIAFGAIAALVGVVLIIGSMGIVGEYQDEDGYYMSDPLLVDRPHAAVVANDTDLLRGRWETLSETSIALAFMDEPNDVRVTARPHESGSVFIGIAPTGAVDSYLSGFAYDEITDWSSDLAAITEVEHSSHDGVGAPGPPAAETFWVESVEGSEPQTLDWTIESGDWTVVIMNADASAGIAAKVAFGAAPASDIEAMGVTGLAIGAAALLVGGLLLYVGLSSRDR